VTEPTFIRGDDCARFAPGHLWVLKEEYEERVREWEQELDFETRRFSARCMELERIIESRVDRAVVDRLTAPVSDEEAQFSGHYDEDENNGRQWWNREDVDAIIAARAAASKEGE
jgi:hypothetical protein